MVNREKLSDNVDNDKITGDDDGNDSDDSDVMDGLTLASRMTSGRS